MLIFNDENRKYDDVLTVKELMDFLAVGKNTAYTLLKNGNIKSFKIGRCYKIPKTNVLAYISTKRLSKSSIG